MEILIEIVADEVEKCGKLSVANSSGLVFVTVGEVVQKGQDAIDGYFFKFPIAEFLTKFIEDNAVRPDRIFFWNCSNDNQSSTYQLF